MKKVLFTLITLLAVMTAQAQSICSTWHIMQPVVETANDDSFTAQNFTYTFNEDGTYNFVDELTMASEPSQTMAQEVATNIYLKGTYTLEGDQLTLVPDMKTYKTELISISMNGRVKNDSNVKAKTNAKINSKDFKAKFDGTQKYTVKVGEASLQMTKGGKTTNFVRIATIKH